MSENHREEVIKYLTKLNERQITIFNRIDKIEKHLDKLNGTTVKNSLVIERIKTWGSIGLFAIPLLINLVLRGI
jgi:GTP-binding protein EngB required for normal cell division